MSNNPLENTEPTLIWQEFYNISQIPRESGNEARVREYVKSVADEQGLTSTIDEVGNIVVKMPASPGYESWPTLVIQGHLDMVCEKNAGTEHDFAKDPIKLIVKDDWLFADRTTLGADNGIAVAFGLAIMKSPELKHGPLEFLFTVDEETGLTGAMNLDTGLISGKYLLNIDSEEEGIFYIGCAGGINTIGEVTVSREKTPANMVPVRFFVSGLTGGHSGGEIHQGFANSLHVMTRFIWPLVSEKGCLVSSFNGGNKHNAIPRECEAVLLVPEESAKDIVKKASEYGEELKKEWSKIEPKISFTSEELKQTPEDVLTKADSLRVAGLVNTLPHGIIAMSTAIPGLVETSTNAAAANLEDKVLVILTSQRSSVDGRVKEVSGRVASAVTLAGGTVKTASWYPAWEPDTDSTLLKKCQKIYRELNGKDAQATAIHAGLECGVIGEKFPGMEMISLGPDLLGPHTPEERVNIPTVASTWKLVVTILEKIGAGD